MPVAALLAVAHVGGAFIIALIVALILAVLVAYVLAAIGVPPPLNWLAGVLVFLVILFL